MAALTTKEKRWIVLQLAVFETPQQVADAFPEEFPGRSITRQQAANYDASKPWARTGMAKELAALFDETRARFRQATDDIPIANKAYRLRRLDALARSTKSPKLEAELMEQAAREVGEAYTNRHVVDARVVGTGVTLTPAELEARGVDLDTLVRGYFEMTAADGGPPDAPAEP